ncbi:MAG: Gfo/Idh/MocA family oxidoreductase [Bryobacterales bacterium]|nr:Gfo/Idh/MocA family oxidoreductase [Bryobacteraceae bacterium]MDW8129888.1 Gfo/Idh/MocA family oxidoreductase [Bryobacterales bacterium]
MSETGMKADRRTFLASLGAGAAGLGASQPQGGEGAAEIGVGLIGCGTRGTALGNALVRLERAGEAVRLVAVCDVYQPRLERAAARFSAAAYREARELIRDPRVKAVVIATPDRLHAPQAIEAVRAGKDVYCEKPLTHWAQFDLLKQLRDEVRRHKAVFQMGTQWCSDPIWERAADQIRRGVIGKVVHVQTGFFRQGDVGERGMPVDDPEARPGAGLDWEAFQGDAPRRPFTVSRFFQWRLYADYSGGPVTDLYPHPLARVLKALGAPLPRRVVAVGGRFLFNGERDVPDTFDLLIEYPQGFTLAVLGTVANGTPLETVIRGSEGTIRLDETFGLQVEPAQGVNRPRTQIVTLRDDAQDHLRNFLECVRTRGKPYADIELGYATQLPLIMAMQSHLEGKVAFYDAEQERIRLA